MKKIMFLSVGLCALVFAGCTTISSTQKFNGMNLAGSSNEKAVCFTHVKMTGWYFFGLPIIVGSAAEDGKCAMFMYTQTTENVVALLTREAKSKGAVRVNDVVVTESSGGFPLFFSSLMIQASGVGVRSKNEAVKQAKMQYEQAF